MKVNLILNNDSALNGYYNIQQEELYKGQQDRVAGKLEQIDNLVDHNECSEMICLDLLDYYPIQARQQLIGHWSAKVEHGGTITLSGLDLQEAARLVALGTVSDIMQINQLFFGKVSNVWSIRKSFIPLQDTISMVIGGGQFDVTHVRYSIDGLHYFITAKRK